LKVHVAGVVPGVTTLGPGRRIGLWVEGCSLRCPGCISPELLARRGTPGRRVEDLLRQLVALAPGHDGLTISGGEPFQQAGPLAVLVEGLRARTSLDVLVYSGYRREELERGSIAQKRLLSAVDMLMDGRFEAENPTKRVWRGSGNQVLHLLSARAAVHARWVEAELGGRRPLQVGFTDEGRVRIIGIPERGFEAALTGGLAEAGLHLTERDHP
jgi:anaerobic ribonucleoside-triphosphate reductase activating protein